MWRWGRSGGCAEDQAARTFFVARVASAATTTSSRSFFMAAMLAAVARSMDASCLREPDDSGA
jgi:hypothetical protein